MIKTNIIESDLCNCNLCKLQLRMYTLRVSKVSKYRQTNPIYSIKVMKIINYQKHIKNN